MEKYITINGEDPKVRAARSRQLRRNKSKPFGSLCAHGYAKTSFCLDCTPSSACRCGSKKHKYYCCDARWNAFGRNKADKQPAPVAAAEPPAAAAEPPAAPEPAKKMRKVMVGTVEIMVEDGATMTIAGVPITFSG